MQQTRVSGGSAPQLKGARFFSFEELKKYANGFSEENAIGTGGYGQVSLDNLSLSYILFSNA